MNPEQLKASLEDLTAILHALAKLFPDRIDLGLTTFLDTVTRDAWLLELLHRALELSKQTEVKPPRR